MLIFRSSFRFPKATVFIIKVELLFYYYYISISVILQLLFLLLLLLLWLCKLVKQLPNQQTIPGPCFWIFFIAL